MGLMPPDPVLPASSIVRCFNNTTFIEGFSYIFFFIITNVFKLNKIFAYKGTAFAVKIKKKKTKKS